MSLVQVLNDQDNLPETKYNLVLCLLLFTL